MEKNFGIFIRGEYQGRENFLIEQFQELLKKLNSEANIKNIKRDNIRRGTIVYFDRDISESQLLKTKYLCDDASATVHSLKTSLVILEAYPVDEVDFVEDVRKQLLKIWNMKVLDVKKIPLSEQFPYIGTGKYVVNLQVPEVDDLEEFKAMGLPDDMVLELPSCDDKLKVKFHCRRCLGEGHVQSSCSNQLNNHVSTTVLNLSSKRPLQESEVLNPKPKKPRGLEPETFRIGERRNEFSTADVYSDLEILSDFAGNRHDGRTKPSAPIYKNNPNQLDDHVSTTMLNQPSKLPLQGDHSEVSNSTPNMERDPEPEADSIGERRNEFSTADVYPDLEIVNVFEGNRRDERTQPSSPNYENKKSITAAELVANLRRKSSLKIPPDDIIIPIGIREIMHGLPNPVLDVNTLENLFNHTRKRSNVQLLITKTYTTNIEGLRQQLKDTITNFYKPPVIGSQEDRDFVKWIEKFLERF